MMCLGYDAQLALRFSNHNSQNLLIFCWFLATPPPRVESLALWQTSVLNVLIIADPWSKLTMCAIQWCGVPESTRNETLARM